MNLKREKKTVLSMIQIFCKGNHFQNTLCDDCKELLDYSLKRIDNCIFIDNKPVCVDCEIHCYNKEMREKIKVIMRYSGPKMIYRHPVLAINHLLRKRNFKKQT